MKSLLCVVLALSGTLAYENSDEFINEINSKQNFWKAGRNFPADLPLSAYRGLLGARTLPKDILNTIPVINHEINNASDIPETFDAREQWPKCKSISQVADQSACGSCWAVSTASAISDRICIHSDGKLQPEISAKNLMCCETTNSFGCEGGYPYYAWEYWQKKGLVTGGPYGSNKGCQPYPFVQCEHHNEGPKPKCISGTYPTPKCVHTCDNSSIVYNDDLIHGASVYMVSKSEQQIQQEMMKNGPVVATFAVYADFMSYKSGVYVKTSNKFQGWHAVRLIGWGVENGVKYWLVMNSWNEDWGEKGLFRIRRATNECMIENEMTGGLPK